MLSNFETAIVRNPLMVWVNATVLSAVEQMHDLNRHGGDGGRAISSCVVVVADDQQVLGTLTEWDVIDLVAQHQPISQLTLGQFLQQRSHSGNLTIPESALSDFTTAIAYFEQQKITHLPIVNAQNQLVGVLVHESLKRLGDATMHQATASLLASQQKILERIAKAEPLTDVLSALLQTMEVYLPDTHCSIALCRDGHLGQVTAPNLPLDYVVALAKVDLPIAEGVGSCGTAAFRRELVVVTDIANDPLWQDYKHFAVGYGLQACSSMPIFASDRTLLGVFGIYYREQKAPQAQELDWIAQAANIAGIAIEREQSVHALRQLNQDLENRVQVRTQELQEREQFLQTVLDTFPLSVFWKDVNSVYLGCNQNFLCDAGLQTIDQIIGKTDYELPWGETEAELYRADDQVVIESQTAQLGIVETQQQADGQTIWLETNKLPLRNLQGDVIGMLGTYQDISDRKMVELALKNSERRYANLAAVAPVAIFRFDSLLNCVYVNERWSELSGRPMESALGQGWMDALHPDDLGQRMAAWSEYHTQPSTESQILHCGEFQYLRPDGTINWCYIQVAREFDDDGNVVGYIGTLTDITHRKNAELALQDLSTRLEFALKGANIGIWAYHMSDERLLWDDRMFALYGISPEEFSGKYVDWFQRVHPDDRDWVQQVEQQAYQGATECRVEFRIVRPDGTMHFIDSYAFNQYNAQGELQKTIGLNLDITERKQAETQINQQMAAIEAAIDGIGILRNGVYLYVNQAHVNLYGYANLTDLIGKSWRVLYSSTELTRFDQEIFPVLERDRAWHGEAIGTRQDGSCFYTGLSLTLTDDDVLICVCRDISESKEYEQRLEQSNAELMRATRLKDEFLANMSHELRTPLNAILGMTEILQDQIFGDLNNQQQKFLQTIDKSSNHLLELINDILDVAKIEAGNIELDCQPTNIASLCESSFAFIKQQAFNKNIQLEKSIPATISPIVIDERRIRQVLINLLNNAVKFTPNDGKITLQVRYLPHQRLDSFASNLEIADNSLEINIIDTGIGIAADQIDRLFQPFVQVESALNRNYSGTGLGLALVKRLVELHGGQVRLTSELGVGSCFTIVLPVAPSHTGSITLEPSYSLETGT